MSMRRIVPLAWALALCLTTAPAYAMMKTPAQNGLAARTYPIVARGNHNPWRSTAVRVAAARQSSRPRPVTAAMPNRLTFAMVMSAVPADPNVTPGAVYRVTATDSATATLSINGANVAIPRSSVRELTVTRGARQPIKRVNGRIVVGYDMGTAAQLTSDARDPVSVVAPLAYVVANADGHLQGGLDSAEIAAARATGAQVWPIVQSGFNPAQTTALLHSLPARWTTLSQMVSIAGQAGISGINIDFEDMQPNDAPLLTQLTAGVSTVLHAMGKWVSIDVTPPSSDPNWGIVYDRAALARVVDYVAVMTYDEHFPGVTGAGSVSSIPWMEQSIQNTIAKGVPAAQILVGIPFYTRSWYVQNGQLHSSELPLTAALADLSQPGATVKWSDSQQQDILTYVQNGTSYEIWLENAASLRLRGRFIQSSGLAGAAIWDLSQGAPQYVADLTQSF